MLHKEFFGLIFLGFVFWIIIATSPTQRIENACRPVGWTGNVVTSLSALVLPNHQTTVQGWFDKLEYGCRYTTWRLFYQEDYNKWKAAQKSQETPVSTKDTQVPASKEAPKQNSANEGGPNGPAVPEPQKP